MKIERIYELEIQGQAFRLSHDEAEQLFSCLDNVLNKNTINLEWLPKDTDPAKIGQPSALYDFPRQMPPVGSERY